MMNPRRIGSVFLLLGATIFVAVGYSLERSSSISMVDFKAVYYGTRCLLQHGDPYKESELLRVLLAEDPNFQTKIIALHDTVAMDVNMPTVLPLVLPFALLPWGPAHLGWMILTAAAFILASYLMWELGAASAPGISGALLFLLLVGSEVLIEVGNTAGIVVSLCAIAAWCFLRERFALAGVLCLAIGLLAKPQDAGLVWLFFLLSGGVARKRALQTLLFVVVLGLPAVLWVSHVAPNWMQELRSNMKTTAANGVVNNPGQLSVDPRAHGAIMIDLQTAISVLVDDPRIYNPATYLLCAPLLLVWLHITLRRSSPENARLALAAIVALSMLPLYHRQHDTRLLLLAIPACAMLWAEGGPFGWLSLAFTGLGTVLTSDISIRLLAVYSTGLRAAHAGLLGKLLTVLLCRPAPLILLAMGVFYLWVYALRASGPARTARTETSQEQPPLPPLRPDASRLIRS